MFTLAGAFAGCTLDGTPDTAGPDAGVAESALTTLAIEPLRPPLPTANASGQQPLVLLRYALQMAVDKVITEFNARGKGTLSWRIKPLQCGYGCNMAPMRSTDGYSHERSWTDVRLHYSRYLGLVQRDIDISVNFLATCVDWSPGVAGALIVNVRPDSPSVTGGSWLEGFVDFLSPVHFSSYITAAVVGSVGSPGSTRIDRGLCSTIGFQSGYSTAPNSDAFVWDVPSTIPTVPGGPALP